jgi:hypothetical protein
VTQYPYMQGPITRQQGVEFVASVAYPNETRTVAKKRVRSAIRYAIVTGKFSAREPYVAGDFFAWAVTKMAGVARRRRVAAQLHHSAGDSTVHREDAPGGDVQHAIRS